MIESIIALITRLDTSTIALIIMGVMLVLYMTERIPIATTSILACLALAIFGVIPMNTAFAGFGNDMVYLIVGMVIVGNALFETGVAQVIGEKIIAVVGTNEKIFTIAIILVTTVISLFMNNSATAALMLPIAASAIAASKGKLTKKNSFLMVGIAVCVGGGITLVGSPPQLIAQGFLIEGGHEQMSFFEVSKFGIPMLILLLVFFLTVGMKLQKKIFDFEEVESDVTKSNTGGKVVESPKSVVKMCISLGILIFCIIGFISGLWSMGVVAMTGAAMTVVTGCISQKRVFEKMDWTTVVIMGCSFGFAAGLEQSGAGRMIATGMINILGENLNLWLLLASLTFVSMIMTNFMSSTAAASILVPIAGFAAMEVGFDIKAAVMIVAVATNIGYATPVSTPPITMTLTAGYRFMDYVKLGGLFNILAFILIVALIPFVFGI
ncbi:MAG: SLC13 family permease [Defluviitaleaceae bacterium]|nr:SLC13 family permease [Defluviitaleaceae bacterium]